MLSPPGEDVLLLFLFEYQDKNGVVESVGNELLRSFLKTVSLDNIGESVNGIVLLSLLRSLLSEPSVCKTAYVDLKNDVVTGDGLFEIGYYHVQISRRRNENGNISHYELIIAENSDGNDNKRMAVLTAESVDSELVEMDCSGMRENVIIDLNEEGRRWEEEN